MTRHGVVRESGTGSIAAVAPSVAHILRVLNLAIPQLHKRRILAVERRLLPARIAVATAVATVPPVKVAFVAVVRCRVTHTIAELGKVLDVAVVQSRRQGVFAVWPPPVNLRFCTALSGTGVFATISGIKPALQRVVDSGVALAIFLPLHRTFVLL
jgi:hypothetical protein